MHYVRKNHLAYFDVNIANTQGSTETGACPKPTTDTITNDRSCYPGLTKNLIHRLYNLPLNEANKTKDLNAIITTAEYKGYKKYINQQIKINNSKETKIQKEKWATHTQVSVI